MRPFSLKLLLLPSRTWYDAQISLKEAQVEYHSETFLRRRHLPKGTEFRGEEGGGVEPRPIDRLVETPPL